LLANPKPPLKANKAGETQPAALGVQHFVGNLSIGAKRLQQPIFPRNPEFGFTTALRLRDSRPSAKFRRMRFFTALAALTLLAGHAAASATLPSRQPGLWQSTTNVTDQSGQPVPHGSNIVSVSCVDPATDAKFFTSGESHCSNLTIGGGGGTYTIDGTCSNQGAPTTIHETLVFASPQAVTLNATVQSNAGPLTVTSRLTYQGDCLPGMAPGDEGSIVDGAFSKADNIDDSYNQ
jgi:hypothetical protein